MRTTFRITALAALALAGLAAAQPAPKDKDQDKTNQVAKPLTHKTLLEKIRKLGYEPELLGDKKTIYRVTVELPNFRSVFDVSLSTDEKVLWTYSYSRTLPDLDAIPAGVLLDLLRVNFDLSPTQFILDAKARRVYLQWQTPNRAFSNSELRGLIETFATIVKRNYAKWTYPVLQPPPAAEDTSESAKLRQKLLGEWSIDSLTREGGKKGADQYAGVTYSFSGTRLSYTNGPRMQVALELKRKK
jgi:hypothetical protein